MPALLFVPEGFRPIAWTNRPAGSMKDRDTSISTMHLHDPDVELRPRRTPYGEQSEPWKALCGAEAPWQRRKCYDERDSREAPAKHCSRCLRRAVERVHVVTFSTRRTGVSNRYGRGASGGGGRNTHARCSCGWTNTANVTKREQESNVRDHHRGVIELGLFRVEREGYAEAVFTSAPDAYLPGVGYAAMVVGERAGGPEPKWQGGRYVEVERVEMPWTRRER